MLLGEVENICVPRNTCVLGNVENTCVDKDSQASSYLRRLEVAQVMVVPFIF